MNMQAYLQYLKYVLVHKYFVFVAGLKTKAPIWLLIIHDWSKFLPDEFFPYADYFNNKPKQEKEYIDAFRLYSIAEAAPFGHFTKDRFNLAWLYHQRRSPHHWQYWYLLQDNDPNFPIPMPEKYVREMVADWAGAGRAITGKWEVAAWYEKNKENILLHPDTRIFVEILLRTHFDTSRGDDAEHVENGFEEIHKVVDWYEIAGWIAPCPKCGTWLTSLGLCSDCGVRYELVEQTKVIDRDSFCRIQKHIYIEGVCAECGHKESLAVEHTLAPDVWVCDKCKTTNKDGISLCRFCDTPRLSG